MVVVIDDSLGPQQHAIPFEHFAPDGFVEIIAASEALIPVAVHFALFESFQPLISSELVLLALCVKERQLGLLDA